MRWYLPGCPTAGHIWPVLAVERAEHELALGRPAAAAQLLRAVVAQSSGVGLVPEDKVMLRCFLGGTNDVGHSVSVWTTVANIKSFVAQAKKNRAVPILLLVPPNSYPNMNAKIDFLNEQIKYIANINKVLYIDIHTPLSSSTGVIQSKYTSDGLHLSSLGVSVVATTIYARIKGRGF